MRLLPIRLRPGADLRRELESALPAKTGGAFVLSGIGSLSTVGLRFAGAEALDRLEGDYELPTLAGSVTADGAHVHASIADAEGRVFGGHLGLGCTIRTTAEILLGVLDDASLRRRLDETTGYPELVVTVGGGESQDPARAADERRTD